MLEYNLKLLINFYRDDVVAQLEEAGSLELLKEIRIWSELSTDSEFIINVRTHLSSFL
ncbi:5315_t:CDS:1, partial [Gigaspora rosea]